MNELRLEYVTFLLKKGYKEFKGKGYWWCIHQSVLDQHPHIKWDIDTRSEEYDISPDRVVDVALSVYNPHNKRWSECYEKFDKEGVFVPRSEARRRLLMSN
jgi:hypothetical protein